MTSCQSIVIESITNAKKMKQKQMCHHISKKSKIDQPSALPAATSAEIYPPKVSREKKIRPSQARRDADTKVSQEDKYRATSSAIF